MLGQNLSDGFKWSDPDKFNLDVYDSNRLRCCVLEVDFECLKNYINRKKIIP